METKSVNSFLKGNCKHGDNCKFSHSINSDYAIVTSNQSQPGNIRILGVIVERRNQRIPSILNLSQNLLILDLVCLYQKIN